MTGSVWQRRPYRLKLALALLSGITFVIRSELLSSWLQTALRRLILLFLMTKDLTASGPKPSSLRTRTLINVRIFSIACKRSTPWNGRRLPSDLRSKKPSVSDTDLTNPRHVLNKCSHRIDIFLKQPEEVVGHLDLGTGRDDMTEKFPLFVIIARFQGSLDIAQEELSPLGDIPDGRGQKREGLH